MEALEFFFFKNNFLCQMSVKLLQDTNKLRYFAITEFKNCFSIRSPSLLFNESNHALEVICHFRDRKKEKSVVSFTHERNFSGEEKCLIGRYQTT